MAAALVDREPARRQGTGTARYSGAYQLRAFGPQRGPASPGLTAPLHTDESTTYVSDDAGLTWRPAYTESAESATDVWAIVDGQTWLDFTHCR